jgi:hypothetical protein
MKNWLIGSMLVLGSTLAQAQAPTVRFHGNLGYSVGGATLASGNYVDGTSYRVSAGSGLSLALGADFRVTDAVTIQATLGSHVDQAKASNGEIAFKRSPVELLAFYDMSGQYRLGGGVRKAQNAELTATGAGLGVVTPGTYESTMGVVLEGQYFFQPYSAERKARWGLGVRLVSESFKRTNGSAETRDGSHLGVSMLFYY